MALTVDLIKDDYEVHFDTCLNADMTVPVHGRARHAYRHNHHFKSSQGCPAVASNAYHKKAYSICSKPSE